MKNTRRALKNAVYKYDEGQCLIRELTCNTDVLPKTSELDKLVTYISQHDTDHPSNEHILSASFNILWGRLTDYKLLRHVEKSLLVIQHLLNQGVVSVSFERFCKERKRDIVRLKGYHYKIDGTEIGQNVRERASSIYTTLWNEVATNKEPSKKPKDTKRKLKKKRKKPLLRFNSHSGNSIESESESEGSDHNKQNDMNGSDIFDIFGELPAAVEQSEENVNERNDDSFIESKTSTFTWMQSAGVDVVHSDSEQQ